jgi:hypothetical protein
MHPNEEKEDAMATTATMMERLAGVVPKPYLDDAARLMRRLRDSLPPVVIVHRIDALERHFDRRIAALEAKLDETLRRIGTKAA